VSTPEPQGITRAEFEGVQKALKDVADAIEELRNAKPADVPAAQAQVQARELTLKDHARALGLTVEEVTTMQEEKEYERFKARQARLDKEKADAAAAANPEPEPQPGVVQRVVDGLGGVRNVKP